MYNDVRFTLNGQPMVYTGNPLRRLLDAGAAVTLNRDDPTFLGGLTLTEELGRAASFAAMSREELLACQRTAVRAAFCGEETKAALLAALAEFEGCR